MDLASQIVSNMAPRMFGAALAINREVHLISNMLRVLEIDWIKEFRLRLLYSNGTVALQDLGHLVNVQPGVEPLRNVDFFKLVALKDGNPTWPDGSLIPPVELLADIEKAAQITVTLDDNDDEIIIAKSGAPEPSVELSHWLLYACARQWRYNCDAVFNVIFNFEDTADADQFRRHWNGRA